MGNQLKYVYDKASIIKEISDREQMIKDYQLTGRLDRPKAIEKIQELRLTDTDVAVATTARLAVSSTPFSQASDQGIIAELQMQIGILTAKLTDSE